MKRRNVGAGPVSAQRGITLIALIITIIVMMILVAVTVTFTIGENGILKNTREAKFKQEVSQLIEFVEMEKAAIIAKNKGVEPDTYDTNVLIQSVPQKLKDKYITSEKIYADTDGKLYYNSDKVDSEEAIWLQELGIYGQAEDYGDFRIEVETTEFVTSYKATLQVTPILTENIFSENEASHIVAKKIFGNDQVTTLKDFIIVAVNYYMDSEFVLGTYDTEFLSAMQSEFGAEFPTDENSTSEQKAFVFLMGKTGQDYSDIIEYAMDVADKTLLIDGTEVTEVTWEEFVATCEINLVGSKEIQLKIDEKVGKKTITFEITDSNLGSIREAVVKTWTYSDFQDAMESNIEDNPDTQIDESKIETIQDCYVIGYEEDCSVLIKYENKVYAFEYSVNDNGEIVVDDIDLIYVPTGYEGTIVKYAYNGEGQTDWMVMYDNIAKDGTVEIVSLDAIGSYDLGYLNEEAKTNATDLNGDDEVDSIEISLYAANNAIKLVNDFSDSLVTNEMKIGKARSIGSKPEDPYYENANPISQEDMGTLTSPWTYGDIESGDENYIQDLQRMQCLGINSAANGNEYYLASRFFNKNYSVVGILCVNSSGYIKPTSSWGIILRINTHSSQENVNASVRPVVTISSETLNDLMSE